MNPASQLLPLEAITARICVLREQRVLLDSDLAALYGVTTGTGSEVMSRIAAPMVGGMLSSMVLTVLAVIAALYALHPWLEV